ncbi:2-octaprenyl-3-methyl-6-methoxy-1,4-benzoquinol hydroxylase [Vibrio sp.]|nr:2-octaprenyl-3-methyl-6-methoxy-1,4-benzoquinol hydroxylase [Vibrio sp.]
MKKFDIAIIGGGMVGAACALGFAKKGLSVALVENNKPKPFEQSQPYDLRVSAISMASVTLLESLGAWESIQNTRVTPYKRLATWEYSEAAVEFNAKDLELEQLGYIIENRVVQLGLWEQLSHYPNVSILCPETLLSISSGHTHHHVVLDSGMELDVKWVVGADGANSKVRQIAGIGVTAWDYRQHCMLIHVQTELPQQDITWQHFTPSGPRSFLPLNDENASLVWYDSPQRITQLQSLLPIQLEKEIQQYFPKTLGKIKVMQSGSFPLVRSHAQKYYKNGHVVIGDAAHTINPLAGQGVNLGFKDVMALLDVTSEYSMTDTALQAYQSRRYTDNLLMQSGMDLIYKGFKTNSVPLKLLRNAAFKWVDRTDLIKKQVLKYAVGLK